MAIRVLSALAFALLAAPATASPALVLINEFNANITSSCDLVELRVLRGGSLEGFQLWHRVTPVVTFGALRVASGDFVLVHLNGTSSTCNPSGAGDELAFRNEYPASTYAANSDIAWDEYSPVAGLVSTDEVLTLYDSTGTIVDAVLASDDPTGTAAATSEAQAAVVAQAGQWQTAGGGVPPGGFVGDAFNANAVQDLNATGLTSSGTSIQRLNDGDTNSKSDWTDAQLPTWGALNSGQAPIPLSVPPAAAEAPATLFASPSVTNGPTTIGVRGRIGHRAWLLILDTHGRRVRELEFREGVGAVTWDGHDESGREMPPGLYFAALKPGSAAPARIIRIR